MTLIDFISLVANICTILIFISGILYGRFKVIRTFILNNKNNRRAVIARAGIKHARWYDKPGWFFLCIKNLRK